MTSYWRTFIAVRIESPTSDPEFTPPPSKRGRPPNSNSAQELKALDAKRESTPSSTTSRSSSMFDKRCTCNYARDLSVPREPIVESPFSREGHRYALTDPDPVGAHCKSEWDQREDTAGEVRKRFRFKRKERFFAGDSI